jgi:ABC-type uncharacterized transport system involved in gliding motility auxiliary subunit
MQGKRSNLTLITLTKIFKHGTSMLVSALALLGFVIIVNYLFVMKTGYIDTTKGKINTLTDQTKMLLKDITFDVEINAFYISASQARIALILQEYQKNCNKIKFSIIDPLKSPVLAQKYGVTEPGTIVFEAKGVRHTLKPPAIGKEHGELELSLMLYRFISGKTITIYFISGHGELSIDNPNYDGLSTVRDRLAQLGYQVETLNLQTVSRIPSGQSIVVITEPKTVFTEEEIIKLLNYLDAAGSICVLGAPGTDAGLSPILSWHGLRFGDNFVYETASNKTTELGPTAPLCQPYDPTEIVEGLQNQNIIFPMVRSVDLLEEMPNKEYLRIMASSSDSWAETNLESAREIRNGTRPSRDEHEQRGPVVVAYTTDTHLSLADSVNIFAVRDVASRSAFFGNARFISNTVIAQFPSNLQLFLNTINWITRNEQVINITPHTAVFTPVELVVSKRRMISWITLFLYPAGIVCIGLYVWYRKR